MGIEIKFIENKKITENQENLNSSLQQSQIESRGNLPNETISTNAGLCRGTSQGVESYLKNLCYEMKELRSIRDEYSKRFDEKKEEFKQICKENNLDCYKDENIKVTITTVDKSYLDEPKTIEFLKKQKLTKYIHTKEYIDYTELVMATTRKEIKSEDLFKFLVEKKEQRVNLK